MNINIQYNKNGGFMYSDNNMKKLSYEANRYDKWAPLLLTSFLFSFFPASFPSFPK